MTGRGTPPPDPGADSRDDEATAAAASQEGSSPSPKGPAARPGDRGSASGSEPRPARVGDVLDERYRLDRRLKEGGMGTVFLAKDLRLGTHVAVKVLLASLAGRRKRDTAARMLQEVHAASRVRHNALVHMLDVGTAPNGDPYLVMELLQGDSLSTMLAGRGYLNPVEAVQIVLPIAHGLAVAHEHHVVHRDLKPENVLLAIGPEGRVEPKLIDFGLAKAEMQVRLTKRGHVLGTPEYMAPEQVRGEDVTHQADVWGFCVLLYELVAGEPPFQGRPLKVALKRVLKAEPTPITELGGGDEQLWAIIRRGLSKNPADRWADMRQLGTALADWLRKQGEMRDVRGRSIDKLWPSGDAAASALLREIAVSSDGAVHGAASPPPPGPPPDTPGRLPTVDGSASDGGAELQPRRAYGRWAVLLLSVVALLAIATALIGYL